MLSSKFQFAPLNPASMMQAPGGRYPFSKPGGLGRLCKDNLQASNYEYPFEIQNEYSTYSQTDPNYYMQLHCI